jgi:hypothetical protein
MAAITSSSQLLDVTALNTAMRQRLLLGGTGWGCGTG